MDHFETQRWWAELAFDPEELAAILAAVDRSIEQDRKARKQAVDAISLNRKYGEAREDELPGDRFEKLAIAPGTPLKEVDPVRMKEIIEAAFKRGEAVGRYLRGQTMRGPERPGQRYGG
jgi:hypothetical protein